MRETSHDDLEYEGQAGEHVTVSVTAEGGTVHLVTYVLDGQLPARALHEGEAIEFNLKQGSGALTRLQLDLDFQPDGSYRVLVKRVTGCPFDPAGNDECVNVFFGPFLQNPIFTFTVE